MSRNPYDVGDVVRVSGAFTSSGAAADPAVVRLYFQAPTTSGLYVYGADDELVKDSTGNYHVDLDANEPGTWQYRFKGLAAGGVSRGAQGKSFSVRRSNI